MDTEEYAVIAAALRKRFRNRTVKPSLLLLTQPPRNLPADPLSEFRDLQRRGFFRRMNDSTFHDYVAKNRSSARLEKDSMAGLSLLPLTEDGKDSANGLVRVARVGFSEDQAFVTLEYQFEPGSDQEHEIGSFLFRRPARGTLRYKPGRAGWVPVETLFVLSGHPEDASREPHH